jgi:acetoin utilization deacetylase AcuC-like enzyme
MKTFFHPEQLLHHPRSYLSRGQMRAPQEVPERATRLVNAVKALDFDVREPADFGTAAIAAVHDMNYLRFLEEARCAACWPRLPAIRQTGVARSASIRGAPLTGRRKARWLPRRW